MKSLYESIFDDEDERTERISDAVNYDLSNIIVNDDDKNKLLIDWLKKNKIYNISKSTLLKWVKDSIPSWEVNNVADIKNPKLDIKKIKYGVNNDVTEIKININTDVKYNNEDLRGNKYLPLETPLIEIRLWYGSESSNIKVEVDDVLRDVFAKLLKKEYGWEVQNLKDYDFIAQKDFKPIKF